VAVSRQFAGMEMLYSILKLVFFLVIWFLMGIFFLPTFLKKFRNLISNEMLLIISVALCLGMVVFANAVGFSPALGAFIMGSILAETTKAEKIEHLVMPVRDLFGAIFFVSVGMLIDPATLVEYTWPILVLCAATIIGKLGSTALGALISGQPLQTSVQAGFSLAQIGEFSFIIATLGLTLNVTSHFLYPIAVAVSAVTTLTTPYLIKSSGGFYNWLNRVLPDKLKQRLSRYSSETKQVSQTSEWRVFIRSNLINGILLSIVIVSIILLSSVYVEPWISKNGNSIAVRAAACLLTLLTLSPFIWALAIRTPSDVHLKLIAETPNRGIIYMIRFARLALAVFFIGFLLHRFFSLSTGIVFTTLILVLLIAFSKRIQAFYSKLEKRFFTNLNQREIETSRINRTELAPWDAHIVPLVVPPNASCIGKTLLELQWRETIGVNVVMIKRNEHAIAAPGKHQMIFPNDELLVLGTDLQIQKLRVLIRPEIEPGAPEPGDVELYNYVVPQDSSLIGRTIRETGIREKANALVVGIERKQERILNPESDMPLKAHDHLFIVANRKKIREYLAAMEKKEEVENT